MADFPFKVGRCLMETTIMARKARKGRKARK